MNGSFPSLKICLATSISAHSRTRGFVRALAALGHRLMIVNERDFIPLRPTRAGKLANRVTRKRRRNAYNSAVRENVAAWKPELVLVFKGTYLRAETMAELKTLKRPPRAFLLNYDDFFSAAASNLIGDLEQLVRHYDCVFTTRRCNVDELKAIGARRALYLPFCYDPAFHFPVEPTKAERRRLAGRVVFIGSYEPERAAALSKLPPGDLAVWGNNWRGRGPASLRRAVRGRPLTGLDFSRGLNSALIALNFFRRANRDRLNSRSFELPACGAFTLSERSEELAAFFREDREVVMFDGPDELRDKTAYYLKNEAERTAIARAGYERVRRDPNTILDRVKVILREYFEPG